MRILVVGDPHGNMHKIRTIPTKDVDLILLTGDLGKADLARNRAFENVEREKDGLPKLKSDDAFKKKVNKEIVGSSVQVLRYFSNIAPTYFIYGNVEPFDDQRKGKNDILWLPTELRKLNEVRAINNQIANFNGRLIGGLEYFIDTCWVREFKPSKYSKRMKNAKKQTDKARRVLRRFGKHDLDILVHHQPPYGFLDKVGDMAPKAWRGKHAGSKVILEYIKKYQPRYAFCGHIHEGEGMVRIGKTEVYNLGVCGYKILDL